jgi:hypothetical protein
VGAIAKDLYPLVLGHSDRLIGPDRAIDRSLDVVLQLDPDVRLGTVDPESILCQERYREANLPGDAPGAFVSNRKVQTDGVAL